MCGRGSTGGQSIVVGERLLPQAAWSPLMFQPAMISRVESMFNLESEEDPGMEIVVTPVFTTGSEPAACRRGSTSLLLDCASSTQTNNGWMASCFLYATDRGLSSWGGETVAGTRLRRATPGAARDTDSNS